MQIKNKRFTCRNSKKRVGAYHKKMKKRSTFVQVGRPHFFGVPVAAYRSSVGWYLHMLSAQGKKYIAPYFPGMCFHTYSTNSFYFHKVYSYGFFGDSLLLAQVGLVGHKLCLVGSTRRFAAAHRSRVVLLKRDQSILHFLLPSGTLFSGNYTTFTVSGGPVFSQRPKTRKIVVRGLAKNPVDHPNGGSSRPMFSKTP